MPCEICCQLLLLFQLYSLFVLYGVPIQSILGKLDVVPVSDTRTIQHHLRNVFPDAPCDHSRVQMMDALCGLSTSRH